MNRYAKLTSALFLAVLTLLLAIIPLATSSNIATGPELVSEMTHLQASLMQLQTLMKDAAVNGDKEMMDKAAKLFRRARWLVYSSKNEKGEKKEAETSAHLRGGIGSGLMNSGEGRSMVSLASSDKVNERLKARAIREASQEVIEMDSEQLQRNMYDATITFPECRELHLEDCLQLISTELASLQISAEVVIREKRSTDQAGYNKVVIITDLTASHVKGRDGNGIVSYPFMWETATGSKTLGVDGKWDCTSVTPEECCAKITESVTEPDVKGNYLQCHIFVPFGGVGNKKRSDRVFVNLSQDGRVQESPFVS